MADTMKGLKRSHYCTEVSDSDIGAEVVVCGFVQKTRDLGNLLFIDLRDRSGIIQLAFGDATEKSVFEKAQTVRSEFVLMAKGTVRQSLFASQKEHSILRRSCPGYFRLLS